MEPLFILKAALSIQVLEWEASHLKPTDLEKSPFEINFFFHEMQNTGK